MKILIWCLSVFSLILVAISAPAFADGAHDNVATADPKPDEKWDVNNPPGEKRIIDIDVDEGTWMSLDVSPDGKMLAFDFLGDIYTMPVSGGKATNIASGMAWEIQPRFSPDGQHIAFTSDRAGGDNIWIMDVNGDHKTQVTKESFRLLNNPTWSPDGQFIAARKHFTTSRSLGTGEIWIYHISGGNGVQLVKKPSETHQKELGEPMFSPDGRYIYYSQNITPGSQFIYAQDSNKELFQIKKYDMDTGKISVAAGGEGGAVRATPSPDGKYLAYVKRVRAKSKLFIKDIESGRETLIYDDLDQDMQETWAVYGTYPNMDWSPDSKWIYFWSGGKIQRINIKSGDVKQIDFQIKDAREIQIPPRPKHEVAPDMFKTTMPRFVQISPNGREVLYESLGKLYVRSISGGKPFRLTHLPDDVKELDPSWSHDGRKIVFVSWTDAELGQIQVINYGAVNTRQITKSPGHYRNPAISNAGDYITYEKKAGGYLTAPEWSDNTGLYILSIDGGVPTRIRESGSGPHFGPDDLRVYFSDRVDDNLALVSTDLLGGDERVHASSKLAQSFQISPDGHTIAFLENYQLYVMPALPGPQNIAAGPDAKDLPVKPVSLDGATYPSWSDDGRSIAWSLGPYFYTSELKTVFAGGDYEPKPAANLSEMRKANKPKGSFALTNVEIITMNGPGGGVIQSGTIIIDGDRISAIGPSDEVEIPRRLEVIDMEGKTVIPGLIDAHAHGPQGVDGLIPQQNWSNIAHLAFGVTTTFNPSSSADSIFPAAELQQAGKQLAPRLFSTGEVVYGAKAPGFFADIDNEADASAHVIRLKDQGAVAIKNYNQPRREQRQQVTVAARDQNILVVPEGGSLYHMDMSLVVDGNSSIEHNIPTRVIYDDVVQLMSQTDITYVPTLGVSYGGISGEDYYYQHSNVWEHDILSRHVPPTLLRARAVRREMAPEEEYVDDDSAANAKTLMEHGVRVAIGGHGQREGLAAHWEMWSFVRGGMTPLQALQTATVDPAKHLGMFDDIGSLEVGKLADMVILESSPLKDIRMSDHIDTVVLGGRLYDARTMNEVFTGKTKRLPYWWENQD